LVFRSPALIFGQAFASGGATLDPKAAVAALSDDAEICGCNGVTKSQVVGCITDGACSLDAVRSTCKASASCGSCTDLVESLLALTLGDEVEESTQTVCGCTSFGHDDVRKAIVERGYKSIPEVMQEMHWRLHANIQKDGTYSVVPRMWGGVTNPRELRAIADVTEKYKAVNGAALALRIPPALALSWSR